MPEKTKYCLFLDDFRMPVEAFLRDENIHLFKAAKCEDWEIARSFFEFVAKINELGMPEKISFDYDLCEMSTKHYMMHCTERTPWLKNPQGCDPNGLDAARWLKMICAESNVELPEIFVHSANHLGTELIKKELKL